MIELIVQFFIPLLFLGVAFFAGNVITSRHEKQLRARCQQISHIRTSDLNRFFKPDHSIESRLFTAEVTLGIDHFRSFLGALKNIFGGRVKSYQKTLDRARREAMTQVVEQAQRAGYNAVANLRLEFVDISGKATMVQRASMVTIIAYGTGYQTLAEPSQDQRMLPIPPAC